MAMLMAVLCTGFMGINLVASPVLVSAKPDRDSAAIVASVNRFHAALAAADTAAVKSLLAADVIVLESGSMESRTEYFAHHLSADIEFARAISSDRRITRVSRNGNAAWVVATSTTNGTFRGRPVNSQGAELMVLTRKNGRWLINAIHWSSARRQN